MDMNIDIKLIWFSSNNINDKKIAMNADKITAGIFSLIVCVFFYKYRNSILQYVSDLQKHHSQEEAKQDLQFIVKIFTITFIISSMVVSIILLYQGITSEY